MIEWPSPSAVLKRLIGLGSNYAPSAKGRRLHDCYLATYPAYLSYFAKRPVLSADDLLVGAAMAFSWMPAPIKFQPELLAGSVTLLQEARSRNLDSEELQQLRLAMGNSMVGASKLLHFIAPATYPIWDSRISSFLLQTTRQSVIQDTKGYLHYQSLCAEIIALPGFTRLYNVATSMCDYPVTPMRAVEFLMFMGANSESDAGAD